MTSGLKRPMKKKGPKVLLWNRLVQSPNEWTEITIWISLEIIMQQIIVLIIYVITQFIFMISKVESVDEYVNSFIYTYEKEILDLELFTTK